MSVIHQFHYVVYCSKAAFYLADFSIMQNQDSIFWKSSLVLVKILHASSEYFYLLRSKTFIIFFHFTINIGMTIRLVPVIGIPLPFLSYGGTSLLIFSTMIFVFLKQDANRMNIL